MSWIRRAAAVAAVGMGLTIVVAARAARGHGAGVYPASADSSTFMTVNAAAKKVSINLYAAYGSANGGMNFNGGSKGDQTITVPLGWSVHIAFQNKDAIPHSAILLPDRMPLPAQPGNPAIARAYTKDLTAGIPTGGTDTMDFTATPAGNYLIVCGVPGHGPSGMYIKFVVSADAKEPQYSK
ncbi:MAG TPA: sulfocyanin-like copper-binding protein [Gemmatimonadaceae bacterium]|nr:sulfocyanin-like copper-binding protein [Gemmatimonadaceae bacterium]